MGIGGRTALSPEGIEVQHIFVHRRWYSWRQITSLSETSGGRTADIVVGLRNGGSFTLPAPSSASLAPHPDFAADRDKVIAYSQLHGRDAYL
jgi:hypothetical protein